MVDYNIPGMNGAEVLRALHDLQPNLPVVMVSGYASSVTRNNAQNFGFREVLEKPVRMGVLPDLLIKLTRGT